MQEQLPTTAWMHEAPTVGALGAKSRRRAGNATSISLHTPHPCG